jgi:hypothetical protein
MVVDCDRSGGRSVPSPGLLAPPCEDCDRRGMLSRGISIVSLWLFGSGWKPRREKSVGEDIGDRCERMDIECRKVEMCRAELIRQSRSSEGELIEAGWNVDEMVG